MPDLPVVTRTFLFTDIEGSTRRWEHQRAAMATALERHDAILRSAIEDHGGTVFKTIGDAFCAVFDSATAAVEAAVAGQRALVAEDWTVFGAKLGALRVRMGLHAGEVEAREGDYFGPAVNRVARLMACGHGGQILVSGIVAGLVTDDLPPACALRDLGERRLKDLRRPEHVFQVLGPGLPADFPALVTLDARPNNLPVQLTSLVGREAEVTDLTHLFRDDAGPRLITLTGAGGTGKTRLALQVAADLLDDFDHGVWFVDLAPLTDPALVVATIAGALGVDDRSGRDTLATLRRWLARRRLLVALDNFERLLPAAPLVADLLAAAPDLKILVTSREALRLRGERTVQVQPLAAPAEGSREPMERLVRYDSVALFLQRATDARPDFVVTAANAPTIAAICARLDGLPLAIELAAARVQSMTPQDILARLGSRLRLLTRGARDLPERHQTIRAAIAWSYELLDPAEQTLFRRLAVFAGGAHLESAAAVCDDGGDLSVDAVDGLASLVEKSLVRVEMADDGWSRYRMLETVREFAGEELAASGEEAAIRARHVRYFVDRCQRMWLSGDVFLSAAARRHYLEPEEDNLRSVLDWSRQYDPEAGMVLVGALNGAPYRPLEARRRITELLERAPQAPLATRAGAFVALGSMDHTVGDFAAAEAHHGEALRLYLEAGDAFGAALAQHFLAYQLRESGQIEAFRANNEQARILAESSGNTSVLHGYHWLSADADRDSGNLDGYMAHLEALRRIHLAAGDPLPEDWASHLLQTGGALYFAGRLEEARAVLDGLMPDIRMPYDVPVVGIVWNYTGRTYLALDQVDVAETFFREGLEEAVSEGINDLIIWHLEGLASVAVRRGQWRPAAHLFGAAAAMRETFHCVLEPAEAPRREREMAELRAALGDDGVETALAEGRALTRLEATMLALQGEMVAENRPSSARPGAEAMPASSNQPSPNLANSRG